mgnify:CR=1 FL=1
MRYSTCLLVRESRFPVGSSAKMTLGLLTNARAMPTRCCWPPLISVGRWLARPSRPMDFSSLRARARRVFLVHTLEHQRQGDVLRRRHGGQQVVALKKLNPRCCWRKLGQLVLGHFADSCFLCIPCRTSAFPARPAGSAAWTCRCPTGRRYSRTRLFLSTNRHYSAQRRAPCRRHRPCAASLYG